MSVLNSKYQNYYSNNITKVPDKNSNNISFKESSNKQINYPIKSARAQNIKNALTTHIKIDLSKYNNNSKKELNNIQYNDNIQRIRTITSNNSTRENIYHNNKISNESKSRYINRSTRRINQKDTKIKYKKVYINLNKDKSAKPGFNMNNNTYNTNNTYMAQNNNHNYIINTQNIKNNNISTISNTYSNRTNNNIIFNNKRVNYIKNQNNDNNKTKERENYFKNNNANNKLNRIENIYLNIHNNNVIKNNNNILIKQNEIHDIIKENKKDKNITNKKINSEDRKEEEENIIIDDEDDIQENLNYDKNKNKIDENIYSNINQEYLKKYFDDNQKIEQENNFIQNTELNTNYMDYIKNEEQKLNKNRNANNIYTNLNLQKQEKNVKQNVESYHERNNKNEMLDSGTSSSINNTIKFQGMYNNFYGKTNNKDNSIRESTNIKNEKVFKNLIPKNSFQKFLTSKIKYYMSEESIPKKFISEFIHPKKPLKINIHKKIISDLHKSHHSEIKLDFSTFNAYYENDNIISEIKRSKSKKNKKPKVIMTEENKELMNKINELKEYIDNSKIEMEQRDNKLKTYLQSFERLNTENEKNKKRIENLEHELKSKNYEVEEKRNEILELNNINNNLEIEMKRLKEEYITETINNREAKENYLIIKNNYNDMKNQFDLLNIKYKTLSDENYNFKRDKMLYEKELKSKNTIIDDLIEDNSNKKELKGKLNKLELNTIEEKEIKEYLSSNKKERKIKREGSIEKKSLKETKKKETFFEKLNIEELMNLRDELIGERTFMTNEFYKIPVKATNKQNERRNELEQRIAKINNKLAKIRIRINILKESKNNKYI